MKRAIWSDAALADFAELDRYFRRLSLTFARDVGERAVAVGRLLAENPGLGPVVEQGLRKWMVRGTDYVILYRSTDTGVEIVRLMNARRDWRPRT